VTARLVDELAARRLDWIVPAWNGPARVQALFTTRTGATSAGVTATLDVLPSEPVWLVQVHGRDVVEIDEPMLDGVQATRPRADAAVTRVSGVVLAVQTADCLPVLFADRAGSVIAVAHAGWRGLAAGVLEATLAAMRVPATDLSVWLGPAIGPRAFEVGPDVYAAYCDTDPGAANCFSPLREGKWLADLSGLARRRLASIGVHDVTVDGSCTYTDSGRFFSYRRDKQGGRMALVAWLANHDAA